MAIAPIHGLYEAHLTVGDLERSIAFYRDTLGLTLAHRIPRRRAAFFWMGAPKQSMLGLWETGSAPNRLRLHISFATSLPDVIASIPRLREAGIEPRADSRDEPVVFGWMPAASVFFDDPDGHSLEYIAVLDAPARPELGTMPLSRWRALAGTAPSASDDAATASPRGIP
jgi:lactoylglutathione lyase